VITGSVDTGGAEIDVDAFFFRAGPEPGLWAERLSFSAEARQTLASELAGRVRDAFEKRLY
jgi:hypothetical protein